MESVEQGGESDKEEKKVNPSIHCECLLSGKTETEWGVRREGKGSGEGPGVLIYKIAYNSQVRNNKNCSYSWPWN